MAATAKYRVFTDNALTGNVLHLCPDCHSDLGKPSGELVVYWTCETINSVSLNLNAVENRHICDRCLWIDGLAHELQRNRWNGSRWIREVCKIADATMTAYRTDVHHDIALYIRRGDGRYIWIVDRTHTAMIALDNGFGWDYSTYAFWNDPGNSTDAVQRYLIDTNADTIEPLAYEDGLALLEPSRPGSVPRAATYHHSATA